MNKEGFRLERHAQLTSHGRRAVERFLKSMEEEGKPPSVIQKSVVLEFLQLHEETIDTRIQPEKRFKDILRRMAEERELPLLVFEYLFRESAKSVLSAVEKKETDIILTRDQITALQEVIEVLKGICDHCGGEGEVPLGEGVQKKTCPKCKGAGEIKPKGIDAEEFEKY
ncbi:hypothetical protein KJA16_01275 [Patescibacteria group bacterium]|nr:hypothetical protein [Patescibacteria group bacterium]